MIDRRARIWLIPMVWLAAWLCWLWDVAGGGAPRLLCQMMVLVAVAVTTVVLAKLAVQAWRAEADGPLGSPGRLLILLITVALAVHWIGVDWEVTGRYYRDEGIYYAAANDINAGDLFPKSFIYGHLPYYFYAFALWVQSLFPKVMSGVLGGLFGVHKEVDVSWILLRGINTTFGALTVIPVFVTARRIAGLAAAVLGSLLIIFSPIYNEITRLLISDVPSAFFAALCLMFVAYLLDEERWAPYLAAGVAAALAAASKFPAGVVAVAIVGIWIAWRIRLRNWSWHLLGAGMASMLAFVVVMPAFLVHSDTVFVGQGKDLLFGFRQYGRGGWIGVQPSNIALWYGQQLIASFGIPVLLLGVLGWARLEKEPRRRLIWMLPYPIIFLALLASMSMVVKRNLLPVLPALAAVLGVGLTGWWLSLGSNLTRAKRSWAIAAMAGVLLLPVYWTTLQTLAMARPSTREEAAAWIDEHVPRGAAIVKESYTPHLHKKKYTVRQTRFVPRVSLEEIRSGQWDYVLLARNAYLRFLDPGNWEKPHHEWFAKSYETMLDFEKVQDFRPTRLRMGPALELYKADPESLEYREAFRYAFDGPGFRYPRDDAYLLLKAYMAPGAYAVALETEPAAVDGRVEAITRDGLDPQQIEIAGGTGKLDLALSAKYFFYIYLPKDTEIFAFELEKQ